jgi:hypothetical protein
MDKFSVFLYCGVIGTMLYKALTSNGRSGNKKDGNGKAKSRQWHMAAWGALSFVVSDLTLVGISRLGVERPRPAHPPDLQAFGKFNPAALASLNTRLPLFANPQLFVMATYYAAQLLIGYSVAA